MGRLDDNFRILVDPDAVDAEAPILRLPDNISATDAVKVTVDLMHRESNLQIIRIVLGETSVGMTSRAYLFEAFTIDESSTGTWRGPGDGDGATLLGEPQRFVALRYVCRSDDCSTEKYRIIHDERILPRCSICDELMELAP